jgi:hypothetical protein
MNQKLYRSGEISNEKQKLNATYKKRSESQDNNTRPHNVSYCSRKLETAYHTTNLSFSDRRLSVSRSIVIPRVLFWHDNYIDRLVSLATCLHQQVGGAHVTDIEALFHAGIPHLVTDLGHITINIGSETFK